MHTPHTRRAWLAACSAFGLSLGARDALALPAGAVRWPASKPLAPVHLPDMDGRTWALPTAGRAMAINLWATWCEPCRAEMPTLQQAAQAYGDRLTVLALNVRQPPATIARFVQETGLQLPVLVDVAGAAAKAWDVRIFPTTILVSANGRPRWRVQGELDWTGPDARSLIESLWG